MGFMPRNNVDRASPKRPNRHIDNDAGIIVLAIFDDPRRPDPILELVKANEKEAKRRSRFAGAGAILTYILLGIIVWLAVTLLRHKHPKNPEPSAISPAHIVLFVPRDLRAILGSGGGGGGGGIKERTLPSLGKAPHIKKEQFVPPAVRIPQKSFHIEEPPTLQGVVEANAPPIPKILFGDPLASPILPPSGGTGNSGGIGTGGGTGIGSGRGPGYGPGQGGGTGGGTGGGIGRGTGRGISQRVERISQPMPSADTGGSPLNRLIAQRKGQQLTFALQVNTRGGIEEVYLPGGRELTAFEKLFLLGYVKPNWKLYLVWQGENPPDDLEKEYAASPGHKHYHIREWVVFTVKF